MHRPGVFALIALLLFGLTGCSLLYSYRNIDRYIRWSLDDYIIWDDTQENELSTRLSSQLEWHQQTQLPRYRDWLEAIDRTLENDIDVTQLGQAADQLQSFWQETAVHLQADIVELLASLSDSQVLDLIAAIREEQADLKSEYEEMTPAEKIKARKHAMTKSIKYWFGTLNEYQIGLIDEWARQFPDYRSHWLNSREHWIDDFEKTLKLRHEPERFSAEIYRLFINSEEQQTDDFRDVSLKNRQLTLQLIADLHNARTQKQRENERKRIAQWLQRLDRLATN